MSDDIELIEERETAADLVRRIAGGDQTAETEMIERYSRGLRFLLRRRTRDDEIAEDLLQDTWAVALQRLRGPSLEEPERLAGFLSGVGRHLALNYSRKNSRQKTTPHSDFIESIPDDESSPMAQASRAEVCGHVRRLLQELGQERDREILNRFYVREQDKATICHVLDVDDSHFNRVLYRARQRLRDLVLREGARSRLRVVRG